MYSTVYIKYNNTVEPPISIHLLGLCLDVCFWEVDNLIHVLPCSTIGGTYMYSNCTCNSATVNMTGYLINIEMLGIVWGCCVNSSFKAWEISLQLAFKVRLKFDVHVHVHVYWWIHIHDCMIINDYSNVLFCELLQSFLFQCNIITVDCFMFQIGTPYYSTCKPTTFYIWHVFQSWSCLLSVNGMLFWPTGLWNGSYSLIGVFAYEVQLYF